MTRLPLLAASAFFFTGSLVGVAAAEDVAPRAAKSIALDAAAGVVYYTQETDGFRVVATLAAGEGQVPMRFTATLSDGEAVTVSVPSAVGQDARAIEIVRNGETLTVGDVPAPMVRASLG